MTVSTALRYHRFGPPAESLTLERTPLPPRAEGRLRVAMMLAPVNPSDLIPITGAYAHRVQPPLVAGYEGVGRVVEAPAAHAHLTGRRVLPLRGDGTWQTYLDCDPALAIPVPDDIPDDLAARAYINPLAAHLMLKAWPARDRHVVLTGAGSACVGLLGQWALQQGACSVTGICRSDSRRSPLEALGIRPVPLADMAAVKAAAATADLAFDAVGGAAGSAILNALPAAGVLVSYGLLSGQPVLPGVQARAKHARFHLRESLGPLAPEAWQALFRDLWPRLRTAHMPDTDVFPLEDWQAALAAYARPGARKPLLAMPS
ncbi:zinc-dependent alcohol dehydrogenase family protein [uncultured Hyphomonas sp.]|uniref:zinc-dependent alcohol dehydrogenase family protein n=1 Tax=uncultured Hyphomonas sp. TaxID=225298 RepID=UPI002AAABF0E|nr:zinc-dependent alcohol dehydrogenase family protein [uncultured Hyphomonas sp.]